MVEQHPKVPRPIPPQGSFWQFCKMKYDDVPRSYRMGVGITVALLVGRLMETRAHLRLPGSLLMSGSLLYGCYQVGKTYQEEKVREEAKKKKEEAE